MLVRIPTSAAPEMALLAVATVPTDPPKGPALPASKPYTHPELAAISPRLHARNGLVVA